MKKLSFAFTFFVFLVASCQSDAPKDTASEEESDTLAQEEDIWEGVPTKIPDNRPLEVRFREAREGLDSAWQAIRQADSIKVAQVDVLKKELPEAPRFDSHEELNALAEQAKWFRENPITKKTIQSTAEIDQYDQHLDRFRQLADSLMATPDELNPKAAKRLKTIIQTDQADIIRRNTYEAYVRKHNKMLENESDSLKTLGFEDLKPASKFNYGTRMQ